jgi:hypothetical protein
LGLGTSLQGCQLADRISASSYVHVKYWPALYKPPPHGTCTAWLADGSSSVLCDWAISCLLLSRRSSVFSKAAWQNHQQSGIFVENWHTFLA